MVEHFFEELLAIMCASLLATVLLQRLRLPNIIAYLLAGSIIGPHIMGWVAQPSDFAFLAEFGVVFLLFALGLEFSLPKLIALRSSVFGLGGIQVVFCTLAFGGAVWLWGTTLEAAIIIAGALALSSTAIVTKELSTLREVHSRHGQLSIGVLLFQDLAAVLFLILVPVLAGNESTSLLTALGSAFGKGVFLVILLLSVGKWLLPPLYKEVALAKSDEVFVLSTLVIVMLASWVTHSFHLSMALGGFVIGMMLGESHFRHQINSDIRAFKDILLGLFFVTIGMNIQVQLLLDFWPRILVFTATLILIKTILISFLVKLSGDSKNIAVQTGLNLAQAGEFGLALLALGVMHGVLPDDQASFIILVAIFSMAVSPFLIRYSNQISSSLWALLGDKNAKNISDEYRVTLPQLDHVIIGGFGRVGKTVARLLEANAIDYIAIDQNIGVVGNERGRGHNVVYGDCSKMEILHSCHIGSARMAILTFSSIEMAKNTIEQIRASGFTLPIIARCCEHGDFAELLSIGADYVVPEMLEASLVIGAQVLDLLEISQNDIDSQIELERSEQLSSRGRY
ncbi:MAG: cation:proton antiporter [Pseudomonadales bacterium]|nr:cation:proton antiporter [Pseudomonadales bacterium]MCP5215339.1 cation:proton antiporter [Pseudomonadales bacterium]